MICIGSSNPILVHLIFLCLKNSLSMTFIPEDSSIEDIISHTIHFKPSVIISDPNIIIRLTNCLIDYKSRKKNNLISKLLSKQPLKTVLDNKDATDIDFEYLGILGEKMKSNLFTTVRSTFFKREDFSFLRGILSVGYFIPKKTIDDLITLNIKNIYHITPSKNLEAPFTVGKVSGVLDCGHVIDTWKLKDTSTDNNTLTITQVSISGTTLPQELISSSAKEMEAPEYSIQDFPKDVQDSLSKCYELKVLK